MFQSIETWTRQWIGTLAGFAAAALDRLSPTGSFRLAFADGAWTVAEAGAATPIGRIMPEGAGARFDPPTLGSRLAGATVALEVPPAWMIRRALDPVAARSVPYLDAFLRHQVERVTPWRVADTYFGGATEPLAEDPARVAVTIGVVPRQLVAPAVALLAGCRPARLSLVAPDGAGPAITVAANPSRREVEVRRAIGGAAAALVVATVVVLGAASWWSTALDTEIAELDGLARERKAVLATAAERNRPKGDPAAGLRALRAGTPTAVVLLDALSEVLPDGAWLTDLRIERGVLRITGIASDSAQLVPLLEASPRFEAVSFFAPTTRLPSGGQDRFHIELKVEPVRSAGVMR
ncbi:PilN domain-containing protein [Prosthecomicrobium sp. N25]|uniref:PilN domain-containing protein n=1 Tax=Prosthecomicrobium sp. N25 TaxID=3129254 RepID=UPI0030773541